MPTEQRALIVRVGPQHTDGLDALNDELRRGWHVVEVTPMGGTGLDERGDAPPPFLAALVVIERRTREAEAAVAAEALEKVREAEEAGGEIVEKDGAGPAEGPADTG